MERTRELQSYIHQWRFANTPIVQVVEELASYSLETKRIPDPYHFQITPQGELHSVSAGRLVKSIVDQRSELGKIEYKALLAVEDLTNIAEDGAIIWISPPGHNFYYDTKLIISEVVRSGNQRLLFNRAVILDLDAKQALELGSQLLQFDPRALTLDSVETLRQTPLLIKSPNLHWSYLLEEFIPDHQWVQVRDGSDLRAKKWALVEGEEMVPALLNGKAGRSVNPEYFGDFNGSCPVAGANKTAFGYIFENSVLLEQPGYWTPNQTCRFASICGGFSTEVGPCKICRRCQEQFNRGEKH